MKNPKGSPKNKAGDFKHRVKTVHVLKYKKLF